MAKQEIGALTSLQEVDAAAAKMKQIDRELVTKTAEVREKISVQQRRLDKLNTELAGIVSPLQEKRAQLDTQINEYCTNHRDEIVAEESKTRVLTHIKLSFHKVRDSVQLADKLSPADCVKKIQKLCSETLQKLILRPKYELNKTAILDYANRLRDADPEDISIDAELGGKVDLADVGIKIDRDREEFQMELV